MGSTGKATMRCHMYFANVTSWGAKARSWLQHNFDQYEVVLVAEHHLNASKAILEKRWLKKEGWTSFVCPAKEREGTSGSSGGCMTVAKSYLGCYPALGQTVARGPAVELWATMGLRCKGFDLVLVALYLQVGVGVQGNRGHLESLGGGAFCCP